ncbi:MAG: hypothetical protein ABIR71_06335 [Chthoniobacterales bacterium]
MSALEGAKKKLVISDLWHLRGWRGKPARSCRVPYREDRSPSGSVLADGRLFHDFGSGETFDGPGLLARVEELTTADACRLFIQLAGGAPAAPTPRRMPQELQKTRPEIELPPMDSPTPEELRKLAGLRAVSIEACEAAVARKQLFCATWSGRHCWIITDRARRNAQLRRLDGEKFRRRDGEAVKALTVRGACASWPVGASDSGEAARVILCEGGGDFLAAYHFAAIEGTLTDVQPVAMLGAAQRLALDALPHFEGKRVRIFPHLDDAGDGAALRWESQLRAAGIDAHCYDLSGLTRDDGETVQDLNDLTRVSADDFEANRELWALTTF